MASPLPPALVYPIKFNSAMIATTYVLSLVTGNVSQVDRLWTFLPLVYTAYWALLPLWPQSAESKSWFNLLPYVPASADDKLVSEFSPRAVLMFGLVFLWMCRLSYNTWRRGLFSLTEEDYRWAVLRKKIPKFLFQIFNLGFIAVIQNMLLLLIAFPTYRAIREPTPLGLSDYVLAATALSLLVTEFTADNQQYAFQTFKHAQVAEREQHRLRQWPGAQIAFTEADKKRGFVTKGLWAWSRHPNFFCEQSFWAVINLFPLLASPLRVWQPKSTSVADALAALSPLAPSISLCILFVSSTIFTESISAAKYPKAYRAYQRRVAMFVPWLTPAWGTLVGVFSGGAGRAKVERLVWGQDIEVEDVKGKAS
ncbi:DUF1295-domain-containing protein [Dentipellis sp. KUC8613]|nr:DUF1295-domain-containing protein [Dentipellis sp. KUC8613]